MSDQRYNLRGVSASKEDVHNAIKNIDKGLFPKAFCKIIPDFLANDPEYCNIMHADGAGTKSALAYVYWRETGDLSVWKGIAQDALIMNIDDLLCVGATDNILLSSTIGRNKNKITGEAIAALQHRDIVKRITSQIQLFHPVIMFRKDQNIQYREKFLYCEDYDLYLNLITQGKKLANLNEKLLNYRILANSIVINKQEQIIKSL